jgi:hypothetical protein
VLNQALAAKSDDRFRNQVPELLNQVRRLNGQIRALGGVVNDDLGAISSTTSTGGEDG